MPNVFSTLILLSVEIFAMEITNCASLIGYDYRRNRNAKLAHADDAVIFQ